MLTFVNDVDTPCDLQRGLSSSECLDHDEPGRTPRCTSVPGLLLLLRTVRPFRPGPCVRSAPVRPTFAVERKPLDCLLDFPECVSR